MVCPGTLAHISLTDDDVVTDECVEVDDERLVAGEMADKTTAKSLTLLVGGDARHIPAITAINPML